MRLLFKFCAWAGLILFACGALALVLNAYDDALLPPAANLIGESPEAVPPQQNMFYAVMGASGTGTDVWQIGRKKTQYAINAWSRHKSGMGLESSDEPDIRVADRSALPAMGDLAATLDLLRQKPADALKLVNDNQPLLDRYAALGSYPRYVNVLPPALIAEFLPGWEYVGYGRRLRQIELAQSLVDGHPDEVALALQQDALLWRRMIAERRLSLIDKMVMLAYLRADFRMSSWLIHAYPLSERVLASVAMMAAPVTADERSLAGPLQQEFRWDSSFVLYPPDAVAGAREAGENWPFYERLADATEKLFLLPRATVNQLYRSLQSAIAADAQSCSSPTAKPNAHAVWLRLRNPVGHRIAASSFLGVPDYSARMCDLQGWQRLLALQLLMRAQHVTDADAVDFIHKAGSEYADPFTGEPMQWLPESRALAFQAHDKRGSLPWPI